MKLIESSVQIIEEKDPYKMIELAGRTCYKKDRQNRRRTSSTSQTILVRW